VSMDLDRRFAAYARAILKAAQRYDESFVATSGRRSNREQEALYALYRAGKHALTVAPPGCSKHQLGLAVDIARSRVDPLQDPVLRSLGRAWRSMGGEWGGERDPVHFAMPGKLCR